MRRAWLVVCNLCLRSLIAYQAVQPRGRRASLRFQFIQIAVMVLFDRWTPYSTINIERRHEQSLPTYLLREELFGNHLVLAARHRRHKLIKVGLVQLAILESASQRVQFSLILIHN